MSSKRNNLTGWILWSSVYLITPRLVLDLQLQGPPTLLARFIMMASGLRALLHLENFRALELGRDLESREHGRDLFKLALIYTLCMFLVSAGGLALIL